MEKYYIPGIEEFHVGFEYEVTDIGDDGKWGWRHQIFEGEEIRTYFIEELEREEIRVKYLDKEDIESLGFKEINSGWYHQFPKLDKKGYQILYKGVGDTVHLSFGVHEYCDELFKGNIKNKSELKRLLKQLNIQ